MFIFFISPHQLRPCGEERYGGLVAAFEAGNVGVFLRTGGVQFIDQIIVVSQTLKTFFLQIRSGPEARTFAFNLVQCSVLAVMQHYIAGSDCVRSKHDRTLLLIGTLIEG